MAAFDRDRFATGEPKYADLAELPDQRWAMSACQLGLEGIESKRLGSRYRSGRSRDWLKPRNPAAPAARREAEEDWGKERWR